MQRNIIELRRANRSCLGESLGTHLFQFYILNLRAADVIRNWLRNRSTLEFLSTWEEIYNPSFKVFGSEHFKKEAGLVTFTPVMSEWVEKVNATIFNKIHIQMLALLGRSELLYFL